MRAWNRAKLLWGYLRGQTRAWRAAGGVHRRDHGQVQSLLPDVPARDAQAAEGRHDGRDLRRGWWKRASRSAEHMMLIGLGEPFLDPQIFDRIEYCAPAQHLDAALDERDACSTRRRRRGCWRRPLEHITLSFDGATKETFEYLPQGREFRESARQLRAIRAHEARARGEGAGGGADGAHGAQRGRGGGVPRFWSAVPGVDQVRVKEDETNLLQPEAAHAAEDWKHPCHYLWRGPMYVKHNGDVYPCCQSYMLDGAPVGNVGGQPLEEIWNSDEMQRMRRLHVEGRAGEIGICSRCLHDDSASAAGGGEPDVSREDGAASASARGAAGVLFEDAREVAAASAEDGASGGGGTGADSEGVAALLRHRR